MRFFKLKFFIVTAIVCLLPVLIGISLWGKLPDTMAIHFNMYGEPDGFASKAFVVFALPLLMVILQAVCCVINDINAYKHGDRVKFVTVTKWIIPLLTVALQIITFGYGLGLNFDVRKSVAVIVAIIFLVIGNYIPKFDYIKNYDISSEKARRINRFIGYETVIMSLLFFISIFLPPVATVVCIWLLIPYAVIGAVYGIAVGRK